MSLPIDLRTKSMASADDVMQNFENLDTTKASQTALDTVAASVPSTETIQDMLASFFVAGTGMSFSYNDVSNTFTIIGQNPLTTENVQDIVGAMATSGTNATATYDDTAGTLTISATGDGTGLTQEQVEDIVGALLVQGTNVTISYNDGTGQLTVTAAGASTAGGSVQTLTPGATITTDAALAEIAQVSHDDNVTFSAPSNPANGMKRIWQFTNTAGSSKQISLATGTAGAFLFGTKVTAIPITAAGKTSVFAATYHLALQRWLVVGEDQF